MRGRKPRRRHVYSSRSMYIGHMLNVWTFTWLWILARLFNIHWLLFGRCLYINRCIFGWAMVAHTSSKGYLWRYVCSRLMAWNTWGLWMWCKVVNHWLLFIEVRNRKRPAFSDWLLLFYSLLLYIWGMSFYKFGPFCHQIWWSGWTFPFQAKSRSHRAWFCLSMYLPCRCWNQMVTLGRENRFLNTRICIHICQILLLIIC